VTDARGLLRRRCLTTPPLAQLPPQIVLYRCAMASRPAPDRFRQRAAAGELLLAGEDYIALISFFLGLFS
jgi:hypothetical protein